jgi:hypothetical protein
MIGKDLSHRGIEGFDTSLPANFGVLFQCAKVAI